ncbi:acyl-CoA dehydrogenase [Novosphingobium sp. AAP83]|uniref:acyl-CoA dehydrogenase family protein n=1 Tax=Novosphingobium sp. AAP83 TaxID=1523425 RepID=UPI0006B895E1|nr:acyl-CoA dehydrogenase family protein [Novosphingobium sp. AAP83]KPF91791.1 acyl-CoA dehydrogenase [Novosphingobium sp. AAP83]
MILSETQVAVRDMVRGFAQDRVQPNVFAYETQGAYPPELFGELAELGMMGMIAPESVGGVGLDTVSYALALIELAAGDGALSTVVSIHNSLIVTALVNYGTPAQQERFLSDLIGGRGTGAFALTEPDAGSDASALRTRAVKVDGGWRLNGSKQFISNGRIAKLAIIFATTDPEAGKRGITGFIVPTDSPGYGVDKVEQKLGQGASDTCTIRFDDLFVPDELVLGKPGEGYRIALSNLEAGRIGIAAQCIGMADAALDIAIAYAKERQSFGQPIIQHQAVGHRLAGLVAKLEAARQLVLHAASVKDTGAPCLKVASMAKLVASETAEEVVSGALQTLGGYGYLEDYRIAKIYRDVRVCQIYEGTSDIQRMVIARDL